MALFSRERQKRNASVRAEERSTVIVFPSFIIDILRQKEPEMLESLQRVVKERMDMNTRNASCE
jgi:hypothetical protein